MGPLMFRLRPGKDDDIKRALENATKEQKVDRSDIIRTALRFFLLNNHETTNAPTANKELNKEDVSNIDLKQRKKTDAEIDEGLDQLLGDF